jgi:hypothetical protein
VNVPLNLAMVPLADTFQSQAVLQNTQYSSKKSTRLGQSFDISTQLDKLLLHIDTIRDSARTLVIKSKSDWEQHNAEYEARTKSLAILKSQIIDILVDVKTRMAKTVSDFLLKEVERKILGPVEGLDFRAIFYVF